MVKEFFSKFLKKVIEKLSLEVFSPITLHVNFYWVSFFYNINGKYNSFSSETILMRYKLHCELRSVVN